MRNPVHPPPPCATSSARRNPARHLLCDNEPRATTRSNLCQLLRDEESGTSSATKNHAPAPNVLHGDEQKLHQPAPARILKVFLHEWWLVKQGKGLAVGGVASVENREKVFSSTVIAKREEANVLHTQDGITIFFRGFINTSRSSQNGVPLEVCQRFLVGFPHDWNKYSPHSFGDSSVSSIDNMERECNSTADSKMYNSEKGIPVDNQANGQSLIGMHDPTGPSGKNTVKPPTSTKKMKPLRQKIVLDAGNSCSRMVTRSISKKMLLNAKK